MNLVVGLQQPAEGMPPAASSLLRTREAGAADRLALHAIAARLVSFGLPRWRDPRRATAIDVDAIGHGLRRPCAKSAMLVAEDGVPSPRGFIHVGMAVDARREVQVAQVIRIVVVADREMRAIGRALLDAARIWAALRGCVAIIGAPLWAMRAGLQPSSVVPGTSHSEMLASSVPIAVAASTSLG